MIQHQGEDPTGKPDTPYLQHTNPTAVSLRGLRRGSTTSRLTGAGSLLPPRLQRSVGQMNFRTPFSSLQDTAHGKHAGRKTNVVSQKQKYNKQNIWPNNAYTDCGVGEDAERRQALWIYCKSGKGVDIMEPWRIQGWNRKRFLCWIRTLGRGRVQKNEASSIHKRPDVRRPCIIKISYADRLQRRNSTSVAELANRWLDRSEMSSWVHGNTFSRRCSTDRDSDQKSTVRSVARKNL
ncbi:hypothetical protein TNCV_178021 [Trichonephila clavipes]|nr:hypothetical protein TNCV_178021 [Trichonephila clavipes]